MNDRIEKSIELAAPVARVWRALTDYRQFNTWFRAALEGPFVVGQTVSGHSTYPGHEAAKFEIRVMKMDAEQAFSFSWPAHASSGAPSTLVEFTLAKTATGTHLRVVESGFAALPAALGASKFRDNQEGWTIQLNNIAEHLAGDA